MIKTNHSLSVDCVLFGYNDKALNVLLVDRDYNIGGGIKRDSKLPGRMIFDNESLAVSAQKIAREMLGIIDFRLTQLHIFSNPNRVTPEELNWINEHHGIHTDRVVTVAYYGVVKLNDSLIKRSATKGAHWVEVDSITSLAMDHKEILSMALSALNRELLETPIAFELLPRRFTIRQLQNLYGAILGIEIDNRNFRKQILTSGIIKATGEKEINVAHKPAEFYLFDRKAYERIVKKTRVELRFVKRWQY